MSQHKVRVSPSEDIAHCNSLSQPTRSDRPTDRLNWRAREWLSSNISRAPRYILVIQTKTKIIFVCAPFAKLLRVFPVRLCRMAKGKQQKASAEENMFRARRKNYCDHNRGKSRESERYDEERRLATPSSNSSERKNYGKTLYHYTHGAVCERSDQIIHLTCRYTRKKMK